MANEIVTTGQNHMQSKDDEWKGQLRGVPCLMMLDSGSANTSAAFQNLCKLLANDRAV